MLTADMLTAHRNIAVPAILSLARDREDGRLERALTERDVETFLAAVAKYPTSNVVVYANRGEFVSNSWPGRARTTTLEYWPAKGGRPAGACVAEADAHRPRANGAWVEVNGKREV